MECRPDVRDWTDILRVKGGKSMSGLKDRRNWSPWWQHGTAITALDSVLQDSSLQGKENASFV